MARPILGWTDRHFAVASALVVAALTGGLTTLATQPYDLIGLIAVLLTVTLALFLDAIGGIVVGIATGAGLIATRQVGGDWTRATFGLDLALTIALVLLGWLTGMASTRLRESTATAERLTTAAPAYGSLGLLQAEAALARVAEEIVRARNHHRPLTLVLVSTEIIDDALPERSRSAVHRTVARLVESLVPETAVPFALAVDEVGVILPETDESAAWDLLGPILDAIARASFADRAEGERRSVVQCAEVHAGFVPLSPEHPDVDRLLNAARCAVQTDRPFAHPAPKPAVRDDVL